MALWRFLDYHAEDGRVPIQEWYDSQDPEVQAAFDYTLRILEETEDWDDPAVEEYKTMTGQHAGLGEIRFSTDVRPPGARKSRKRRFRPLGVRWPARREFVLLVGCEKQGGRVTIPPGAFDQALRYKSWLAQGRGSVHDHV